MCIVHKHKTLVAQCGVGWWVCCFYSDAGSGGGAGGQLAHPIFGRSVNPIPTGEGRSSPPITNGTPNVFHLPASLF